MDVLQGGVVEILGASKSLLEISFVPWNTTNKHGCNYRATYLVSTDEGAEEDAFARPFLEGKL